MSLQAEVSNMSGGDDSSNLNWENNLNYYLRDLLPNHNQILQNHNHLNVGGCALPNDSGSHEPTAVTVTSCATMATVASTHSSTAKNVAFPHSSTAKNVAFREAFNH